MIECRDFVFTGLQPWDMSIGSNARDIALEISKHNRVLYVNTPLVVMSPDLNSDDVTFVQRIKVLKKESSPLRQINENLWLLDYPFTVLPVNSLPDGPFFDIVNKKNNRKMFKFVKEILEQLGFSNIIHFIDNDVYRSFFSKEFLCPALSIYYLRDNLREIDFWKRHILRLEPKLIAKSDLVLCNSTYLKKIASINNVHSFDVGQGVDLSSYQIGVYDTPSDIKHIPHPIVGYMGTIVSLRLDPDLIYNVALANPTISFVMVGGEDEVFTRHRLHTLKNVYFLGAKPSSEVHLYIRAFDICINPQVLNGLTNGNYPRKIDEYLALGKPIIATKTEAMDMFKQHVYLSSSADEYNRAIEDILKKGLDFGMQDKIEFAHTHSWQNSVNKIYKIIQSYEQNSK